MMASDDKKNDVPTRSLPPVLRDGTLKVVSGSASLNSNVSLVNQNAIFKFTLSGISIDATHPLVIKDNNKTIAAVTPATTTNSVYVAMPGAASTTYKFIVDNNDNRYLASGTATIVAGKYYQTTLAMTPRYPLAMTSATVDDIGSLLGSDGIIYATGAVATAASTTAIGVIALSARTTLLRMAQLSMAQSLRVTVWCSA